MPETLLVELHPAHARVEPGAAPAEATVTLQNLGDVVQQYAIDVEGLDPNWYTLGSNGDGVGLFPKDKDQVRLTFHPPVGSGVRAGSYPFEVRVRSRDGAQQKSAQGVLDVRGQAVLRLDLMPLRQTAKGKGRFHVQATNTGSADGQLTLEATDAEEACRFEFPKGDSVAVPAKGKIDLPVVVIPRHRPWMGEERTYDFTITGKSPNSRNIAQPFPGQFTYQPRIRSFGPFVKLFFYLGLAGAAVMGALIFAAQVGQFGEQFRQRYCNATSAITTLQQRWPCGEGPSSCHYSFYNREFYKLDKDLVGECRTNEVADAFGNTRQVTTNGVLFWLKASQSVYFLTGDKLYVFENAQVRLLDSPEKR
jgi:hypothetical protein